MLRQYNGAGGMSGARVNSKRAERGSMGMEGVHGQTQVSQEQEPWLTEAIALERELPVEVVEACE